MMKYFPITILFLSSFLYADDIRFKGQMDAGKELGIEMTISCDVIHISEEERTGNYLYDHIGKNITLDGFIINDREFEEAGAIYLQEMHEREVSGAFILQWDKLPDDSEILTGYWTNFKNRYHVNLFPIGSIHFQDPDSAIEFTLVSKPTSFEYSDLYLNFEDHKNIKVGTVPNCDRDGRVGMAWLKKHEDGSFDLTIREEFWGNAPGDREYVYSFASNGIRKN